MLDATSSTSTTSTSSPPATMMQTSSLLTVDDRHNHNNHNYNNHNNNKHPDSPYSAATSEGDSSGMIPPLTDTDTSRSTTDGSTTSSNLNVNLNLNSHDKLRCSTTNTTNTNNTSLRSDQATASSLRSSCSVSGAVAVAVAVKAPTLHQNLMRCQRRDPMDIYELVAPLGEGSMGSVCKVQKRSSAMGGSARAAFVRANQQTQTPKQTPKQDPCCSPVLELFQKLMPSSKVGALLSFDDDCSHSNANTNTNTKTSKSPKVVVSSQQPSSLVDDSNPGKKQQLYALKSLHLDRCNSQQFQQELLNEVAILRELDHPNIARAMETYDYDHRLFIVLELCSGGDLYSREPYTEEQAGDIIHDILSAISYLHSKGIIHRDIKFENIMFVDQRPEAEVKIIDFGLSQKFGGDEYLSDAVGTVYTMAPELLAGNYNAKVDVWSVGVIAFMLLSSSMPFYGSTRYQVMKRICKANVKFSAKRWSRISKYGQGFVRHLLEPDPQERPSADRALRYTKTWLQRLEEDHHKPSKPGANTTNKAGTNAPSRQQERWGSRKSSTNYSEEEELEMMDRIQASILAFSQYSTLKKLGLMVIAYKSTASEIGWLRTTFSRFDILQNGEISFDEFSEALSDIYDYTPEELYALFRGMDIDGTDSVHYTEFLAATIEAHGSVDEDRIADAFDRIDCDDSGYITIQNLRDFLGEDVPKSHLEAIIDEADIVRDKRISYPEFFGLWDQDGDEILQGAKRQVAQRRLNRAESRLTCGSLETSSTADDLEDDYAMEPQHHVDDVPVHTDYDHRNNEGSESFSSSFPKTPVINNVGTPHCGAAECFNKQKAMSLRVGWF